MKKMRRGQYPPRVFKTRIRQLLESHPQKPAMKDLAASVGVTPLTMQRIADGANCKLMDAMKICLMLAPAAGGPLTIGDVWEVR
jgi:DNA-binding XRE family transcriptional regulator